MSPFEMASTMVMATKHSAKYSHAPILKASSATDSQTMLPMTALKKVPVKEATMPIASALPDWPFRLMGYPSQQVDTEEAEPGMPRRTEPIKEPEQPPIQSASRKITAVPDSMV
ncbi:hypothetical protein SDC9_187053 [bioreactor metagenome]|uniref:Uncharacterized protein n=1 Tax=bioreactor metagenome TaxID=1076179 RepID=A0A645HKI0_9ZZZZ